MCRAVVVLCMIHLNTRNSYQNSERGTSIMSNAVFFNSYKLRDGASVPDFLLAVEKLMEGHISKQEGYVSFKLLAEGDAWADYVMFETVDHLNAFLEASQNDSNELAGKFYSFLDFETCKTHIYSVEKSF